MPDVSLEMLQAMVQRVLDGQKEQREDLREIKGRLTALELGQAAIKRDIAASAESDARIQGQLDRLSDRVERIERRLDLVDLDIR